MVKEQEGKAKNCIYFLSVSLKAFLYVGGTNNLGFHIFTKKKNMYKQNNLERQASKLFFILFQIWHNINNQCIPEEMGFIFSCLFCLVQFPQLNQKPSKIFSFELLTIIIITYNLPLFFSIIKLGSVQATYISKVIISLSSFCP